MGDDDGSQGIYAFLPTSGSAEYGFLLSMGAETIFDLACTTMYALLRCGRFLINLLVFD